MSGLFVLVNQDPAAPADTALIRQALAGEKSGGVLEVRSYGPMTVGVHAPFSTDSTRHFFEDDRIFVACDGEFYNAVELAQGGPPVEAALVAALWRKQGVKWFATVRGSYAVFVYDKQENHGYAFADGIGIKPLVYAQGRACLGVASRLGWLRGLPGFNADINPQAVFSFMEMEMIPTPFTIHKGARKLESGHYLDIQAGKAEEKIGWRMAFPPEKKRDEAALREETFAQVLDAVRMSASYRIAPERLGCFLSGGTDSSAIAGLIHQLFPGQANTFSIGFAEEGYDEMEYSRIAAKAYATNHLEYYVTAKDILDALPSMMQAYDEPFANSSAIPTYFCAKLAHDKGMDVMLGGDGGDEIFGGNKRYVANFKNFSRFPGWLTDGVLSPALNCIPQALKVGLLQKADNYVKRSKAPLHERIHAYSLAYYLSRKEVFGEAILAQGPFESGPDLSKRYLQAANTPDVLDQYLYNDLKLTLADNDLPKVTRMTELAGVQVRFPLLDTRLVAFTGLIPPEMKVKGEQLRYLYKEAMKRLLPEAIINKPKHGFGLPVVRWMMRPGPLNDLLRDTLAVARSESLGLLRKGFLQRLYDETAKDKTTFFGTYLYYAMVLELWLQGQTKSNSNQA